MKHTHLLWVFIIIGFCGLLYLCWGIFTPFIISLVIAYLWSPVASFIESRCKWPRWTISLCLVVITIGVLLFIILLLLPLIYHQVFNFIELAPNYKKIIDKQVIPFVIEKFGAVAPEYIAYIKSSMVGLFRSGFDSIIIFIRKIWSSGLVIVDLFWFILLVPFITFNLIKDWDRMIFYIKNAVPIKRKRAVNKFFSDVNKMVTGVIRGQFNVCLIYSVYYTAALSALGVKYSILLGITTGLINFIPFVGIFIGLLASLIVVYLQFGSLKFLILTALIFIVGASIDSGVISPKLVGKRVGLHPVWSIFSILLGGKLFGFIGMLVAIPLGATVAILIKIILKYYYKSELYTSNKVRVKPG